MLGACDKRLNNDFQFMTTDAAKGALAVRIGLHIRRSNPRGFASGRTLRSRGAVSKRHQIIQPRENLSPNPSPSCRVEATVPAPVGLGLHRPPTRTSGGNFEFIQQTWLNNPNCNGLHGEKDPLIGDNDSSGMFTVHRGSPTDQRLHRIVSLREGQRGRLFLLPASGHKALTFSGGGI